MEKDFDLKCSLRELVENITYILKTRTCSTIYKNVYIDMSFIMPRLLRMHCNSQKCLSRKNQLRLL